jgi:hypothetical protein
MTGPTDEQIRARAYQLWEAAGRPDDRQDEFWHEAERELSKRDGTNDPDEKSDTFLE